MWLVLSVGVTAAFGARHPLIAPPVESIWVAHGAGAVQVQLTWMLAGALLLPVLLVAEATERKPMCGAVAYDTLQGRQVVLGPFAFEVVRLQPHLAQRPGDHLHGEIARRIHVLAGGRRRLARGGKDPSFVRIDRVRDRHKVGRGEQGRLQEAVARVHGAVQLLLRLPVHDPGRHDGPSGRLIS